MRVRGQDSELRSNEQDISLLLVLNFSIGVSASSGYDRQEADAPITISID